MGSLTKEYIGHSREGDVHADIRTTTKEVMLSCKCESSDLYHFGHLNRQPVYFHSRLVPKNITNN